MKKPLAWAAGGLLGAVMVAGFIPVSLWSTQLNIALREQFALAAGLEASAADSVMVAALPYPRVIYTNVRLGHPEGSFTLTAARLTTELSLFSLLTGRLEFASLRLVRPEISIDASGEKPAQAAAIKRVINAPPSSNEARSADSARLGSLKIVDGLIRARASDDAAILIERVDATLDWPNLGASASLTGRGTWRGERFDLDLLLAKPAEVLRGERSTFIAKLSSRLIDLSADGALAGGAR